MAKIIKVTNEEELIVAAHTIKNLAEGEGIIIEMDCDDCELAQDVLRKLAEEIEIQTNKN